MKKIILLILVVILIIMIYKWISPQFNLLMHGITSDSDLNQVNMAFDTKTGPQKTQEAVVYRAIDGDTVELVNGQKVRYIGIDSPEIENKTECFGQQAKTANANYVEGKTVKLEKDVSETDEYGRLLRYVYVGNLLINEELIKGGYAKVATFPPDVKYLSRFKGMEKQAKDMKLGLWSDLCTKPPAN